MIRLTKSEVVFLSAFSITLITFLLFRRIIGIIEISDGRIKVKL